MSEVTTIELRPKESWVLDLIGRGPVGYSWVYDVDNEGIVRISHQYIVPPNPKPGQQGLERFTITAIQPGSCLIKFRQIQSWEKDQAPLDTRTIRVDVIS
jgi:predicted secreted protein